VKKSSSFGLVKIAAALCASASRRSASEARASAPAPADWIGRWIHAGGEITISKGRRGNLRIRGEAVYPAAQNVHSGVIRAEAKPAHGVLQFADDGSVPFNRETAEAGNCLVRMQRIAALLVIGSIPFFLGLTVVMPVLGHATWHLYRRAVEPDPDPHPDYQPRERSRRSAADFPAALFPTRR